MKITKACSCIFLILGTFSFAHSQSSDSLQLSGSRFNFLIGHWDLYYNGSKFGESNVDTILDGHAIQEDFLEFPPDPFHSINITTYNPDTKSWEQTMVDNMGHHSFFIGKFKDGKAALIRNFKNKNGEDRMQRTTFYNINKDSFDWTFDASSDEGKTWNVFYTVHYVRKK